MGDVANQEPAIKQFRSLMEGVDEPLKGVYEIVHQGCPTETMVRFLKARDWNVAKAFKMLVDCLEWRMQNEIDTILTGLPVIAVDVGLSTYDKASMNEYRDRVLLPYATKRYGKYIGSCVKILDMIGLKFSALNQIKVVKPLLQERTRRKVQVLHGCPKGELLKVGLANMTFHKPEHMDA